MTSEERGTADVVLGPGSRLRNGAIVVAMKHTHDRGPITNPEAVVLALSGGMSGHPYATWRINPETGDAYGGDYCLTFEGAIRSYAARTGFLVETLGNGIDVGEADVRVSREAWLERRQAEDFAEAMTGPNGIDPADDPGAQR